MGCFISTTSTIGERGARESLNARKGGREERTLREDEELKNMQSGMTRASPRTAKSDGEEKEKRTYVKIVAEVGVEDDSADVEVE